jgi:hypothetical protein
MPLRPTNDCPYFQFYLILDLSLTVIFNSIILMSVNALPDDTICGQRYKTFYGRKLLTTFRNKLERLFLAKF